VTFGRTGEGIWFPLPGEPSQAEYEILRTQVLEHGLMPSSPAAARFARRGLAGLIAWPAGEVAFRAVLVGARRPAWSPYADPRLQVLADTFALLLESADRCEGPAPQWAQRRKGRWAR
jgi:hypothetical protein